MKQLLSLSSKPKKASRVYKVENIDAEKGITATFRKEKDKPEYVVCLFMDCRTVKTVFPNELSAINEIKRYKELYKPIKKKSF